MLIDTWVQEWEKRVPLALQEEWDVSGKQAGRFGQELSGVVFSLDLTREALDMAKQSGANLIFTHHPILMRGVHGLDETVELHDLILSAVESGIALYASHTPFDIVDGGVNDVLAEKLGLFDVRALTPRMETDPLRTIARSRIGTKGTHARVTLEDFAQKVKEALGALSVVYYGDPLTMLTEVACLGGSGMSVVDDALRAGAQVLITGDVKYHDAQDAVRRGLFLVDPGHYATEFPALARALSWSKEIAPEVEQLLVENGHESLRHGI